MKGFSSEYILEFTHASHCSIRTMLITRAGTATSQGFESGFSFFFSLFLFSCIFSASTIVLQAELTHFRFYSSVLFTFCEVFALSPPQPFCLVTQKWGGARCDETEALRGRLMFAQIVVLSKEGPSQGRLKLSFKPQTFSMFERSVLGINTKNYRFDCEFVLK